MFVYSCLFNPFAYVATANGGVGQRKYLLRQILRVARKTYDFHKVIAQRHDDRTMGTPPFALDLIEPQGARTEIHIGIYKPFNIAVAYSGVQ